MCIQWVPMAENKRIVVGRVIVILSNFIFDKNSQLALQYI